MKLQIIIAFVLCTIAATSCKKKAAEPQQHIKPRHVAYGTVTVNRNGQPWPMRVFGVHNTGSPISTDSAFSLVLSRYVYIDGDSILRDAFNIGNVKYKQYHADLEYAMYQPNSPHPVTNLSEYCFYDQYFDDGDVVAFSQELLLSEPHFIEVTSYNDASKEVSGRFSASFLSENKKDTTRWTDGVFSTKIFPE